MNDFSWIGPTLKLVASGALETIIIAVASVVIAGVLGVLLGVLLCLPAGRPEQRSPMGSYALPSVVPLDLPVLGNALHRLLRLPITGT